MGPVDVEVNVIVNGKVPEVLSLVNTATGAGSDTVIVLLVEFEPAGPVTVSEAVNVPEL